MKINAYTRNQAAGFMRSVRGCASMAMALVGAGVLLHDARAEDFVTENFEGYGLNTPWVSPELKAAPWNQWPGEAPSYATIGQPGHKGNKAVTIFNEGGEDYCIRTASVTKRDAWLDAASNATVTYYRFYFYVPKDTEDYTGVYLHFSVEQTGSDPFHIGPFIAVMMDKRQGQAVLASNGPGDGIVQWQKVGKWDYDQWIPIDVVMHSDTRKYDVTVGREPEAKDLEFRMGQFWDGEVLGPHAQARFGVPPGAKIRLDDITFSTKPLSPNK